MKQYSELTESERDSIYSSASVADSIGNTLSIMPDEKSGIPAEIKAAMDEVHLLTARAEELRMVLNDYANNKPIRMNYIDKDLIKKYL